MDFQAPDQVKQGQVSPSMEEGELFTSGCDERQAVHPVGSNCVRLVRAKPSASSGIFRLRKHSARRWGKGQGVFKLTTPTYKPGARLVCVPWPTPNFDGRPTGVKKDRRAARKFGGAEPSLSHYEFAETTATHLGPPIAIYDFSGAEPSGGIVIDDPRPGQLTRSLPLLCKFGRFAFTVWKGQPYAGRIRWHQYATWVAKWKPK